MNNQKANNGTNNNGINNGTNNNGTNNNGTNNSGNESQIIKNLAQEKQKLSKLGPAGSIVLHLETLQVKYQILLNKYNQIQGEYSQYLSQYPPGNYIQNGTFEDPQIANNSYQYITSSSTVPNWNFQNAVLMNNSSAWGYPTPYPKGNQAVTLQNSCNISQTVNLNAGTYLLRFSACGRNCCDNSNESNIIDVQLNGNTIYQLQPPVNSWKNYSTQFTIDGSGNTSTTDASGNTIQGGVIGSNTLSFVGTWTSSDRSSAIQNIQLVYNGLTGIAGNSFLGQTISHDQVDDLNACIASCSKLAKCSGATYNDDQKICSLQSGQGQIIKSSNPNNYAILSANLTFLQQIKNLNQQLIDVNDQIEQYINQGKGIYRETIQDLRKNKGNLNNRYQVLLKERAEIMHLMKEFEKLEAVNRDSSLASSTNYSIFLFLSILSLIVVVIIIFMFAFTSASSNNNSSTFTSNLLKDGVST
jgi:hypothetical protein